MNEIYENYNVLKWLEKLLNEKLGNKWLLEFKDKKLILKLFNEKGSIIFDNLVFNNTYNNKNLTCSDWNSKLEGFSPPIEDLIPAPGLSKLPLLVVKTSWPSLLSNVKTSLPILELAPTIKNCFAIVI